MRHVPLASARVSLLILLSGCAATSPHGPSLGPADASEDVMTLPYDDGGVLWDGWASEFVTVYCVTCHNPQAYCIECHASGDVRTPDFSQYGPVAAFAPMIRCGVAETHDAAWGCDASTPIEIFPKPGIFPNEAMPSDADRARIVSWFDNGMP